MWQGRESLLIYFVGGGSQQNSVASLSDSQAGVREKGGEQDVAPPCEMSGTSKPASSDSRALSGSEQRLDPHITFLLAPCLTSMLKPAAI